MQKESEMENSRTRGATVFSRREMLAMAGGLGVAAAISVLPASAATGPVQTRAIPRTGERLPVVGLGTAIVFDIGEDAAKRTERRAVIQAMVDGGARVIDTAPSYGTAELVVGDLLSSMTARDKIFLATKVRVADRDRTIAEMQASLKRLRVNHVDLMQLHNVNDAAMDLRTLREWQQQGHTRYIGVTHFQSGANDRLAEVIKREKPEFVQLNFSLAERSVEDYLLPLAADTGTAVLVNLPFGRGKLFSAVRGKALPEWAKEFDAESWGQFFLKYLLSHPAVTCVIPGMDKPEYVRDNLDAGRGRLPDAAMRRRMVEYWNSIA
jgi:aryl-alcohol dehydrogenase-like predicted oxidoreductase